MRALVQDLEQKFEKFGRVVEVRIVRNPASGESRGFGFVGMSEEHEVDAVSTASCLPCALRACHQQLKQPYCHRNSSSQVTECICETV